MQTAASQREVARIEEQILRLAERLDALPDDLSDKAVLGGIESQLGGARDGVHRGAAAAEDGRERARGASSELSAQLRDVAETGRTPDLSASRSGLRALPRRSPRTGGSTATTLARLEQRLGALADAIEKQEERRPRSSKA